MLAYAVFNPLDYWPLLATFLGGVAALLALDLFVIEKLAHGGATPTAQARRQMTVSAAWTAICVLTALGVAWAFRQFALAEITANPALLEDTRYFKMEPAQAAGTLFLEFLTGYVVELSLSIDNLFVFLVIFRYFGLDHDKQHRVLFWGIVGAVVFRAIFIGIGSVLVSYAWVLVLMGIFLIVTGIKLVTSEEKKLEPEKNPLIRMLSGVLPVSKSFDGTRFFTRLNGALTATPLFVALIVVETTDIAFAVDSVPAVLAISQEPLVAFGSNICAILGLRAMFFVVAEAMQKFHLLKYGLGLVLVWVGLKMTVLPYVFRDDTTNPQGHVPIPLSLGVIVSLIAGTMLLSLVIPAKESPDADEAPANEGDANA
ncbi:MAG: TerC/Alx family metal homeostasis membrane protein [bacterium]